MKKLGYFILVLAILFSVGCKKDPIDPEDEGPVGEENPTENQPPENQPPQNGGIVEGDPTLNTFLITSIEEILYTVDPGNGSETGIFRFDNLTNLVELPDFKNGIAYVNTNDNAINAIDLAAKDLIWDTPMLNYDFNSYGVTSVTCIDGVCYASGNYGVAVAVDQASGALKWYYSTDPNGELDKVLNENGTPMVYGDKVYIFSDEGFIDYLAPFMHVLDRETGELLQKVKLPHEVTGTPVFKDDMVYLPSKNLYAIDLGTLDIVWTFEANGLRTPAYSDGKLVVNAVPAGESISSALFCLDAASGEVIWQVDTGIATLWAPLIVQDVVFSNYDNGSGFAFSTRAEAFALELSSGKQLWYKEGVNVNTNPVYANGHLFFHGHDLSGEDHPDGNVGLMAMDANTGEVLWLNGKLDGSFWTTPLIVADNGVFGPSYYRGK